MASVTDFVMVRFCTARYGFMRKSHKTIMPWLDHKKIIAARKSKSNVVYFELPEDLHRYITITEELMREMAPLAREVTTRLSAIRWTPMKKFRDPLTVQERRLLAENNIVVIL